MQQSDHPRGSAVEHTIEFGGDPEAVIVTTSGPADRAGFVRLGEELVSDPRFRPGMSILVDHTNLDASTLTNADVRAIADFAVDLDDRIGPSDVAVVVPNALTFGLIRMAESRTESMQFDERLFYSRDEAAAWLRERAAKPG